MFGRRRGGKDDRAEEHEGAPAGTAAEAAEASGASGGTHDRDRGADGAVPDEAAQTRPAALSAPSAPSYDRADGPYDPSELADDDPAIRVDLGGLRVPVLDEVEVRLDVDQQSQQVVSATVVHGDSTLQLVAFAAPRGEGLWDDVRKEIAGGIGSGGGTAEVARGVFGSELLAMLPAERPDGGRALIPARFAGIDGPRWFLRALYTGPASREAAAATVLDRVVRGAVVVRGTDPMAPGDALPLRLPEEVPEGLAAHGPDGERAPLAAPERGPEITEIR